MMASDGLISRSRKIGTGTWSDALDRLRVEGVVHGIVWRSGSPTIAGRAVTVRLEVGALGVYPAASFDVGSMLNATSSGSVLVVDMGAAEVSTFGGLAARAAVAKSVEGVVIDGGCRDLADINKTGCRLCSRHVVPTSGKERARLVDLNGKVMCGTVSVSAGDFVLADHTGVVIIPAVRFPEVFAVAEELAERDRSFDEGLLTGQQFDEMATRLRYF
jgi:regulator of RNase E activity RraA